VWPIRQVRSKEAGEQLPVIWHLKVKQLMNNYRFLKSRGFCEEVKAEAEPAG